MKRALDEHDVSVCSAVDALGGASGAGVGGAVADAMRALEEAVLRAQRVLREFRLGGSGSVVGGATSETVVDWGVINGGGFALVGEPKAVRGLDPELAASFDEALRAAFAEGGAKGAPPMGSPADEVDGAEDKDSPAPPPALTFLPSAAAKHEVPAVGGGVTKVKFKSGGYTSSYVPGPGEAPGPQQPDDSGPDGLALPS